jgi:MSHA pilin protein MshA
LAALAIPRYVNLEVEARKVAVSSVAGAVSAAAELVHGKAVLTQATTSPITLPDGTTVEIDLSTADYGYLYPVSTVGGIGNAVKSAGYDPSVGLFCPLVNGMSPTWCTLNCGVIYINDATHAAVVTMDNSGC